MVAQLPLEFNLLDSATFSNFFFSQDNKLLANILKNFVEDSNQEKFFYLWGHKESGKTHLLQACCSLALEKNISAIYISLDNLLINQDKLHSNFFDGLENLSLLCIDDLQLIINNHQLEESLFYLFNNILANQHKLIVSANCVPSNLEIHLPDLKSRMTWGITYYLHGLTEKEKITALIMRAEQIGLQLNETVANFLLARLSRNTGELFDTLELLDTASLAAKRKLTIPFVKKVLKL